MPDFTVITVENQKEGTEVAKDIIYDLCGRDTVLFLSGGKTPKPLYEVLAKEKKLKVGALAMVDERWGLPMHPNSNERMITNTGLFKYARSANIPIYLELKRGLEITEATKQYNEIIEYLFNNFPERIAILGIGSDGHIASIPPILNDLNHLSESFVMEIKDFPGEIKERITLTLNAISKMDLIIILAFGKEKRGGIKIAIKTFFSEKTISIKTILITDQKL